MRLYSVEFYRISGHGYLDPSSLVDYAAFMFEGRTCGVPDDMLRYDTAFVCEQRHGIVCFPHFVTREGVTNRNAPTSGRWSSFSCILRRIGDNLRIPAGDDRELIQELRGSINSTAWVTRQYALRGLGQGQVYEGRARVIVPLRAYVLAHKPEEVYPVLDVPEHTCYGGKHGFCALCNRLVLAG